uniref:Secreted protein n=1 Tax=Achlya hypogyna TaxID=1202772 RepID=A0A0A7CN39_ACHHY|nr:secreted protein [Achlya hypogyna]
MVNLVRTVGSLLLAATSAAGFASFLESPPFPDWHPTDPKNMAPCPMLNSLANHGVLPRTNITASNLRSALGSIHCDSSQHRGVQELTLKDLDVHNAIEHDASLTRLDAALGSNTKLNSTLLAELLATSADGKYITKSELAQYRVARETNSRKINPSFTFGVKQQVIAYAEAAALFVAFQDATGAMRVDWIKMFFAEEKLPFELGWTLRPITLAHVLVTAGELRGKAFSAQVSTLLD